MGRARGLPRRPALLVYRRRDGGDYAVTWSQATTVPAPIMQALPDVLAVAMLEGDGAED